MSLSSSLGSSGSASSSRPKVNLRSTAVKRIMQEAAELAEEDAMDEDFVAAPLESDIFEWHCTMRGVAGSEYEGGIYHFRIVLPASYPMSPPDILLLTPNGRFELGKKICIDGLTSFHVGSWQPAWGVRTAILGLRSFWMQQQGEAMAAVGAMSCSTEERKRLAAKSRDWTCPTCEKCNKDILPDRPPASSTPHGADIPTLPKLAEDDAIASIPASTRSTAESDTPPSIPSGSPLGTTGSPIPSSSGAPVLQPTRASSSASTSKPIRPLFSTQPSQSFRQPSQTEVPLDNPQFAFGPASGLPQSVPKVDAGGASRLYWDASPSQGQAAGQAGRGLAEASGSRPPCGQVGGDATPSGDTAPSSESGLNEPRTGARNGSDSAASGPSHEAGKVPRTASTSPQNRDQADIDSAGRYATAARNNAAAAYGSDRMTPLWLDAVIVALGLIIVGLLARRLYLGDPDVDGALRASLTDL